MNYEGDIAMGLVNEILNTVYKYSEAMTVATAVGCLEIAKLQLLQSQMEDDDEE